MSFLSILLVKKHQLTVVDVSYINFFELLHKPPVVTTTVFTALTQVSDLIALNLLSLNKLFLESQTHCQTKYQLNSCRINLEITTKKPDLSECFTSCIIDSSVIFTKNQVVKMKFINT